MNSLSEGVAWLVFCALISIVLGWAAAHTTVAKECDKLGAFYVGDVVYECKKKDKP